MVVCGTPANPTRLNPDQILVLIQTQSQTVPVQIKLRTRARMSQQTRPLFRNRFRVGIIFGQSLARFRAGADSE